MIRLFIIFYVLGTALFSQNHFLSSSNWVGDLNDFEVVNDRVKLNGDGGESVLRIDLEQPIECGDISTQFGLHFSPSSSNQLRFVFAEDSLMKNGVELRIGSSGDKDALEVWNLSTDKLLASGEAGLVSEAFDSLEVTLYFDEGEVKLLTALDLRLDSFLVEVDFPVSFIKLSCIYTKTRAQGFYFDFFTVDIDSCKSTEMQNILKVNYGDLLISELMIDPTPQRLLPDAEFIELYNNSKDTFNLKDFYFEQNDERFPLLEYVVHPGQYVVLSNHTVSDWLVTKLPSLNNETFEIKLYWKEGLLMHNFFFDRSNYYFSGQSGGRSVELKSLEAFCSPLSFSYSTKFDGGTPMMINSEAREVDVNVPRLLYHTNTNTFWDTPFIINEEPTFELAYNQLEWANQFCDGTILDTLPVPKMANYSDEQHLEFTEVLTNPVEGCPEFIEFQNTSDIALVISLVLEIDDGFYRLPENLNIETGGICVLTTNLVRFLSCYNFPLDASLVELPFSNLNSSYQELVLTTTDRTLLDKVSIDEEMFHSSHESTRGVSLVKINDNWTSNVTLDGVNPGNVMYFFPKEDSDYLIEEEHVYFLSSHEMLIKFNLPDFDHVLSLALYDKYGQLREQIFSKVRVVDENIKLVLNTRDIGFYMLYFEWANEYGKVKVETAPLVIRQ